MSQPCLTISNLHSLAVDYQKSGTPVRACDVPRPLRKQQPDFLSPRGKLNEKQKGQVFESDRLLGKLYRSIEAPLELPQKASQGVQRNTGRKTSARTQIHALVEQKLADMDDDLRPTEVDLAYGLTALEDFSVSHSIRTFDQACGLFKVFACVRACVAERIESPMRTRFSSKGQADDSRE